MLKYKDRASYADGRETDLTGEQAYGLYGEKMAPFVLANGGKLLYAASANPYTPRESMVIYLTSEIFGAKWRNWKILLKELDTDYSVKK